MKLKLTFSLLMFCRWKNFQRSSFQQCNPEITTLDLANEYPVYFCSGNLSHGTFLRAVKGIMLPSKRENLSSTKLLHLCKKKPHLHWIPSRGNIHCKYKIYVFFQFSTWLLQFLFYVLSQSSSFFWLNKF